jgi:hypothetical protein
MPRSVDLSGCQSKLAHAREHINALATEIDRACGPGSYSIPLTRRYEPAVNAVVYRIGTIVDIPDQWALMVGDAIHDMRGALDHLMYQLAIVALGRTPTERENKSIQFPEIRRLKDFNGRGFLTHVRRADVNALKPFQPYKRLKKGQLHPLPKLIRLSNIDKHRKLHLMVVIPRQASFTNRPDAFRDCVPDPATPGPSGQSAATVYHRPPRRSPRPGDEALRVIVRATGPNPDVDFAAQISGDIGIGRLGPVIPMLRGMADYVGAVLSAF